MSDIIDINVGETIEEVTINVVDNVIIVNINKVTGGGGSNQNLAETLVIGNETDGTNIKINNADAIELENSSLLKKGTYDFGQSGGISRICGVGYEDMWQGGIRHVFDSNGLIRNSSNGFDLVPNYSFDASLRFKVGSIWTLDNGTSYICTDATTGAAVWELQQFGQVNSDWNATSGVAEILNKPSIPTNTSDLTNDSGFITAAEVPTVNDATSSVKGILKLTNDLGGTADLPTVPALSNKVDKVTGKGLSTNDFTNTLKTKLDGIAEGAEVNVNADWNATSGDAEILNKPTIPSGTVTSVGLTMPSAFNVASSPITSSGTLAVTGAGLVSQYVRGDGTLANFPASTGGGASLSFYLNGSVSQGTFGGVAFKEMDRTPILGAGTDFTINANGYIQSFITDANVPNQLEIPAGNWNFETYFSANSGGGTPTFYIELYKWNGTTLSLIASNSSSPEGITNGTAIDLYVSALAIPQTTLLATDRLAVRIYVNHSGRTITLHTEDNHLCQVITTFTTGLTALNGLTTQVQNLAVGTSGTDFAISSTSATHTFNLPTASATNRGALSSTDWTTFNNKQNALGFTPVQSNAAITGATKTKITYDSKGLVTAGADLIASDIPTIAQSQVTNLVTDLAGKQATLSYTPYRFIQTGITAHTGTVAETIIATATIAGGTFNTTDVMKVMFGANKAAVAVGCTQRIKINTSNTLTGAVTLAGLNTTTANALILKRNFVLNGGNLYGLQFSLTNTVTDEAVVLTSTYNNTPFNTANTLYLFFTVQLGATADSVIPNLFNITN